jgi:hypothetical protein
VFALRFAANDCRLQCFQLKYWDDSQPIGHEGWGQYF